MSHFTVATASLALLNDLRNAHSMSPLKAWKESKVKLADACNKLYNADIELSPKVTQDEVDMQEQADEKKAAAQRILDNKAKAKDATVKRLAKDLVKATTPTKVRQEREVANDAKKAPMMSVADYCKANGINPKIARAKLRKAGVKQIDGHWVATAAAIAALTK